MQVIFTELPHDVSVVLVDDTVVIDDHLEDAVTPFVPRMMAVGMVGVAAAHRRRCHHLSTLAS
jgi:hypothetical protein